jgi:hypothetical protein
MGKKLFILFIFSFVFSNAQPGKEAWHWWFGQAGIDFSQGAPIAHPGVIGYLAGAVATISDKNTGQFLFLTDGVSVQNKAGYTMSNGTGLLGDYYTCQTLIAPHPGNSNLYYVFSVDKLGGPKGIHYSIVDMSQSGGLGKVITKNKVLALPRMTEKITAVRQCDGIGYWIVTHAYNSNAFMTYKLGLQGLDTVPVISYAGTSHSSMSPNDYESTGYMKASPNGAKLAAVINSDSLPLLEILDINNLTGIVSNPITILFTGMEGPNAVSFSPDNSKLYTCVYHNDSSLVYQYDLSSGVPAVIQSSGIMIGKKKFNPGNSHGIVTSMQLAPDGKIYIGRYYLDTLAVVENPNLSGASCNLQWNGFITGPPSYEFCMLGLPNFIDANYAGIQIDVPDVKQCTTFKPDTLDAGPGYANYYWSTGDSTQITVVNNPGTYWVTVTNQQGCTKTDTVHAYLITPGTQTVSVCLADTLNTTQSIVLSYNWSDGTMNPVKTFTASGVYWEDVSFAGGCKVRDSFVVNINPDPVINLGRDTAFCKGDLLLNAYFPSSAYVWSTGETSAGIHVKNPGTYYVKVTSPFGCISSDTLTVSPDFTAFNFIMPNIVTPNGDNLNDELDFGIFQLSSLEITIYNRWGNEVFRTENPDAKWKPLVDDGTYFWTMDYRIDCGPESKTKSDKGFVTILR